MQHVADALLVENLLLARFHAALVHLGLVRLTISCTVVALMVAHGSKEEIHGFDAVVIHGVPRGDLRSPLLLYGENLLFGLLDALGRAWLLASNSLVALVNRGISLGAALSAVFAMTLYRIAPMIAETMRFTIFQTAN